jgi:hypothetical protein
MFGLSGGELFLVVFITVAVVSARWWARLGSALGELSIRGKNKPTPRDASKRGTE